MVRPPEGLCLKCSIEQVRDADTVCVRVLGRSYVWPIRLIDCWAPDPCPKEATQFVKDKLAEAKELRVWIPAPKNLRILLKNLTFDRIPGYIFVDANMTLNELVVAAGHATKGKPPKG